MLLNVSCRKEQGAILVLALLFLFVTTLLVMQGLELGTMEIKMSDNIKSYHETVEVAQTALNELEKHLVNATLRAAKKRSALPISDGVAGFETSIVRRPLPARYATPLAAKTPTASDATLTWSDPRT